MQNFNYHSHTYRCGHADLSYTDEEYVLDYIKMGFKKIAFTDHVPEKNEIDKRKHMRMKYSQKDEYLNTVKELKKKYADKIEIQTGFEAEYLPAEEENLLELKSEVDKMILGQHFIYDNDKNLKIFWENKEYTDEELMRYASYIESALKFNIPDIIAHPDIFMVKAGKFGEVEEKVANIICKAAEKYQVPIEINLNGIFAKTYFKDDELNHDSFEVQIERLKNVKYPCKNFWDIAKNYNVKVVYGIDTHNRGQIALFNELVKLAEEIIGKENIEKLNFVEL